MLIFRTRIAHFYYFAFIVVYKWHVYFSFIYQGYISQRNEVNNLETFVYQKYINVAYIIISHPLMNSYMCTASFTSLSSCKSVSD